MITYILYRRGQKDPVQVDEEHDFMEIQQRLTLMSLSKIRYPVKLVPISCHTIDRNWAHIKINFK